MATRVRGVGEEQGDSGLPGGRVGTGLGAQVGVTVGLPVGTGTGVADKTLLGRGLATGEGGSAAAAGALAVRDAPDEG